MPTAPAHVRREHVEAFIVRLLERFKPATADNRYRALRAFFKWLLEEGEVKVSPMANMTPRRPPGVAEGAHRRPAPAPPAGVRGPGLPLAAGHGDRPSAPGHGDAPGRAGGPLRRGRRPRSGRRRRPGEGAAPARLPVRAQDGQGARPLPAGAGRPPAPGPAGAVAQPARAPHRLRRAPAGQASRCAGRDRYDLGAPVPAYVRPQLARRRWPGGRPDAPRRLAVAGDARPLRGERRRRAGAGGLPEALPGDRL